MPASSRDGWNVPASEASLATISPIFDAMKQLTIAPKSTPRFLSLAIGDPTVFGNLKTPQLVVDAVTQALATFKSNGYTDTEGSMRAREAVAETCSSKEFKLTGKDVFMANGASGAIWLAIGAVCPRGSNVLLPRPGFTYCVAADPMGVECRYYDCLPEENWQIDLKHLESLIDSNTSAILVNNPSNPCGSNFTVSHLTSILEIASRNYLPIISDEIYAGMNWTSHPFTPLYSLPSDVPIITIGGLAKRWLVPGWRVGWVVLHERGGLFKELRRGISNLSQTQLHPNTVFQTALPTILKTPPEFFENVVDVLRGNARLVCEILGKARGLHVIEPQGALYAMVQLDYSKWSDIKTTFSFAQKLMDEENVLCLPGECFFKSGFVRLGTHPPTTTNSCVAPVSEPSAESCLPTHLLTIVISHPEDVLREACGRMVDFCERHAV